MKKLLLFLTLAAAALWWWQNPEVVHTYAAKAAHKTGMFLLNLYDKPAEASVDVQKTPQAVTVPSGVYYTRDRVTLTLDGSTRVVEKGAQVRKIGEGNGKFLVEDAVGRFSIEPHVLTQDGNEVGYIVQKAAVDSARNATAIQTRNLQAQIEEIDHKLVQLGRELQQAEAIQSAANLSDNRPKNMTTPPGFLRNEILRKEKERTELRQRLMDLGQAAPPPPTTTSIPATQAPLQPTPQFGQGSPPGGDASPATAGGARQGGRR